MQVKECIKCLEDDNKMIIIFDNGMTRIFNIEDAELVIPQESFYKDLDMKSKEKIMLAIMLLAFLTLKK